MGFLTKAAAEEDQDRGNGTEELYERLFPKIGRDFISRRDFINIMRRVLEIVDPDGVHSINLEDDAEARTQAVEYQDLLDRGRDGTGLYKDLVELDD